MSKFELEIPQQKGNEEDQVHGPIILHYPAGADAVRFSNRIGSLQFAPWTPVPDNSTKYVTSWTYRGDLTRTSKDVWAQIRVPDGNGGHHLFTTTSIEGPRDTKEGIERFPPDGVYDLRTGWLVNHTFKENAHHWASYDDVRSNAFWPLYWHPDGYAWNSHFERDFDHGEQPLTMLAAHNYFRWIYQSVDYTSIRDLSVSVEAAFDGDLNGATAHFFVLIADYDKGRKQAVPSSGRWHQMAPERQIKLGANWQTTTFTLPSSSGWVNTFRRRGRGRIGDDVTVDLTVTDGFGIAFHNLTPRQPPRGILKIKKFQFVPPPGTQSRTLDTHALAQSTE